MSYVYHITEMDTTGYYYNNICHSTVLNSYAYSWKDMCWTYQVINCLRSFTFTNCTCLHVKKKVKSSTMTFHTCNYPHKVMPREKIETKVALTWNVLQISIIHNLYLWIRCTGSLMCDVCTCTFCTLLLSWHTICTRTRLRDMSFLQVHMQAKAQVSKHHAHFNMCTFPRNMQYTTIPCK